MWNFRIGARWRLLLVLLGISAILLACGTSGEGTANPATGKNNSQVPIKLDNSAVEVRDANGDWTPVSDNSPLDLTAKLENTDPWTIAGKTLQTDESTQIEEGLQTGDLVRVQGLILEDGTWLANSIERADEQVDPIITLVGRVDSMDPWTVNGIQWNVTQDTDIQGTVTQGMFVQVEILLSPDGTWEVLSIAPLGEANDGDACVKVASRVISVNGNEVQLSGWPAITLDETINIQDDSGDAGSLTPGQTVLITICPSGENQAFIKRITLLNTEENGVGVENGGKVLVCHKPKKKGGHTISISPAAVPAHLAHGDTEGPCPR